MKQKIGLKLRLDGEQKGEQKGWQKMDVKMRAF